MAQQTMARSFILIELQEKIKKAELLEKSLKEIENAATRNYNSRNSCRDHANKASVIDKYRKTDELRRKLLSEFYAAIIEVATPSLILANNSEVLLIQRWVLLKLNSYNASVDFRL